MRKKLFLRTIGLVVLSIFLLSGCGRTSEVNKDVKVQAEEEYKLVYETTIVERGDVIKTLPISCNYSMMNSIKYQFDLEREIVKHVYVETGDFVQKGDVLAVVDSEDIEKKITNMEYNIAKQKLLLQQTKENRDFDISTSDIMYSYTRMTDDDKDDRDEAIEETKKDYAKSIQQIEDEIAISEMRMQELQEYYNESRIVAGMDGSIFFVKKNMEGSLTRPEETVITIYDINDCLFTSDDVEAIQYLDDNKEYSLVTGFSQNTVEHLVKPVRREEWGEVIYFQTVEPEFDLDVNTKGTISITTDERKDVLRIETDALHQSQDKYFVYIVDEEGIRKMQYVDIGLVGDDYIEIKSGLTEGQYIIK